ncbi:MAG: hypothetical protein IJU76_01415 [Desulfovibrionaceae bacterium]|nr:hypothetical protein [Desulfovibrionaceae bacterium]
MVASYVAHALPGRVRLRHALLLTLDGQARVRDVLAKVKGVTEIQPGHGSLLVFFTEETSLPAICESLEGAIPEFASQASSVPCTVEKKKTIFGVSPRKAESRTLLAAMGVSAALGFFGSGTAHVIASAVFGVLALRHVWVRREAM